MIGTFILIFYLHLLFVLPYLCHRQSEQWSYDIKTKTFSIMKTLNLTTSELLMLRMAMRNERDNTIDEKMSTDVYNEELISYYDNIIDKMNDLINKIEDLI